MTEQKYSNDHRNLSASNGGTENPSSIVVIEKWAGDFDGIVGIGVELF